MKIHILTNFDRSNYGSALQAFALHSKLGELGADSLVLCKNAAVKRSVIQRVRLFFGKSAMQYSKKDKLAIRRAQKALAPKRRKMAAFCTENIPVRPFYDYGNAALAVGDADAVIVGSDQVWSSVMLRGSDMLFALDFVPTRIPRYAYAASVGESEIPEDCAQALRRALRSYSGVSVRERSAVGLVQSLTEQPVRADIDPTLLYDSAFWEGLASDRAAGQDYIFVYMLRPEPVAIGLARRLREKTGLKICLFSNRLLEEDGIENITDAGVEDFLSYVKHARYVVTNSFHGTAFAVQFRRQFLSVAVAVTGSRVRDFLSDLGLEARIAQTADEADAIDRPIDWEAAGKRLDALRADSLTYLRGIVNAGAVASASEEIVLYRDKSECCGCAACANACPHGAIVMEADEDGFVFPRLDPTRCVRCGLCKRVCTYQNGVSVPEAQKAVAAVAASPAIRKTSASGGAFAAVAQAFLQKGGVVCGCEMQNRDGRLTPAHRCIENVDELPRLQSSKYSQSDVGMTYREVKKHLDGGGLVLFSGTPCQVAGLRGFLRKPYDNLFTMDLVCHGVPSTAMFNGYQAMEERKHGGAMQSLNFRDKDYGWSEKGTFRIQKKSGAVKAVYFDSFNSSYYNIFLKSGANRESCYSCRYANLHRVGDLTIGDFWGVKKNQPELLRENGGDWEAHEGISCVLVNTEQGERLLREFGGGLDCRPSTVEQIAAQNKMLLRPSACKMDRARLMSLYRAGGYEAVDRWFRKEYGKKLFVIGKWSKLSPETRAKLKKIKKRLPF